MFTATPESEIRTLVALPAHAVPGADADPTLDPARLIPTTVVDPVPATVVGTRSILAPTTTFRGATVPTTVVRSTLALERRRRAERRAADAMLASARPRRGHPVTLRHDGTNAFERSIIVTAARIRADRNAARFGTARFGR